MRILHICHLYTTEGPGGVQEYVRGIARAQRALGHEVQILAGSMHYDEEGLVAGSTPDGLPVTTVHRRADEALSGDLGSSRIGAVVDSVLARFGPDLCHVHHWQGLTNDLARRAAQRDVPVVITLHDLYATCPLFFRMRVETEGCRPDLPLSECARCLLGRIPFTGPEGTEAMLDSRHRELQADLLAADAVSTMSAYMRDRLVAVPYFRRKDIEVLPIGVAWEGLGPVAPPAPDPGRLRIANWAGLAPRKGIHVLLAALADSSQAHRFEVHLYGRTDDSEYAARLRRLQGGVDVHWHGPFTTRSELEAIAASTDVAVFPSIEEPYGLAQDEAMLLGMPLVVTQPGAPTERVGARGIVIPASDPGALRTALERLLGSPELLRALRQAPAEARTLAQHVPQLQALYERVVAGAREEVAAITDVPALLARASADAEHGRLHRARRCLDRALALAPELPEVHECRGRILLGIGAAREAAGSFDRLVELRGDAAAFLHRGRAWALAGEQRIAIGNFDRAIDLDPSLAEAFIQRGRAWLAQGDARTAVANLDRAIELDPEAGEAYGLRGMARLSRGDLELAIGNLDRAILLAPTTPEFHDQRGLAYARKGDATTALFSHSMAIAVQRSYWPAWQHRGELRLRTGDAAGAEADFRQAASLQALAAERQSLLAAPDQSRA
jgi:glycosyltransferase involved in cell wall biosynthesis/regulator of sirC expression with transglutaminase-like and TPR domain